MPECPDWCLPPEFPPLALLPEHWCEVCRGPAPTSDVSRSPTSPFSRLRALGPQRPATAAPLWSPGPHLDPAGPQPTPPQPPPHPQPEPSWPLAGSPSSCSWGACSGPGNWPWGAPGVARAASAGGDEVEGGTGPRPGGVSPPTAPPGPAPRKWSLEALGPRGPPTGHSRSRWPSGLAPGARRPTPPRPPSPTCLRKRRSPGRTRSVWKVPVGPRSQARPDTSTSGPRPRGTPPQAPHSGSHPLHDRHAHYQPRGGGLRFPGPLCSEGGWGAQQHTVEALGPLPIQGHPRVRASESQGPQRQELGLSGGAHAAPEPHSREQVLVLHGG